MHQKFLLSSHKLRVTEIRQERPVTLHLFLTNLKKQCIKNQIINVREKHLVKIWKYAHIYTSYFLFRYIPPPVLKLTRGIKLSCKKIERPSFYFMIIFSFIYLNRNLQFQIQTAFMQQKIFQNLDKTNLWKAVVNLKNVSWNTNGILLVVCRTI